MFQEKQVARRKSTGAAEDLMEAVALLPWWAGVVLAVVSFALLHGWASQPLPQGITTKDVANVATAGFLHAAAYVGQWVVPLICLAGAAASAIKRRQRSNLLQTVQEAKSASALDDMTWKQFEMLVGEGFRQQGYSVQETGGGGGDGGIDLVLRRGRETFFVQCKQWRATRVGVAVAREVYGVMAAKGADGAFIVTSGRFTDDAVAFAEGRNIKLVNGEELRRLIRAGRRSEVPEASSMPSKAATTPACPACGSAMVKRVARRGSAAGHPFWGCSTYPACKGTTVV
ncbi:restriction endonuclease [Pseudacidovorax sp.]|uniref:restriction endonuclease n=1 Tax=Pseudacidovorax sp. TaxID=1934311 RepID=UPI0025F57BDE|nr:restriction endonuclease [Pseudacidovorax sp.]